MVVLVEGVTGREGGAVGRVWERACGSARVGARVWELGCGNARVGARVWERACGSTRVGRNPSRENELVVQKLSSLFRSYCARQSFITHSRETIDEREPELPLNFAEFRTNHP